ncbi:GGDEF domain-containing protein, partial [Kineococcus glutinatus]|uniref:GGDEF domain-containing protein n=1 Tax=Kineococcus glutinatus TaxID=1070872 RepID=UPI0031E4F5C7
MLLTLAVTLAAVGAVQYALMAQALGERAAQFVTAAHSADAKVLLHVFNQPGNGVLEVETPLDHIAVRPGVERVALIDADGTVLAVGRGDYSAAPQSAAAMPSSGALDPRRVVGRAVDAATARRVREVAAGGRAVVDVEDGASVVRVPLLLHDDVGVLEVVRTGDELRQQVADLRQVLVLTLLAGLGLAVPAFYLLGGRGLSSRHGRALASSETDVLTGMRNRRSFHADLGRAVAAAHREQRPLVLVLVDLDGFKQVNDTHGHRRGDAVLSAVAAVLGDVVAVGPRGGTAYRIGGDEFALLLPAATTSAALRVAERVRSEVSARVGQVTTSIGVAALDAAAPDSGTCEVEALVEHADA